MKPEPIPNDLVGLAMIRATRMFGGTDRVFNNAGFAQAFKKIVGMKTALDGNYVRAILCGRSDCVLLKGGSHYRLA